MKKGISPIIASVILILITVSVASMISPWIYDLITNTTANIGDDVDTDIQCQNAGFDFVTSYGTYGVDWNFTDQGSNLNVSIRNTGSITLYDFSFEIVHNATNITHWEVTTATQKTSANALRPGESAILVASIRDDINGTLNEVTIMNAVCPTKKITNNNF